jgi:hypothetical protein
MIHSSPKKEELSNAAIITDTNVLAAPLASKLEKYKCRVRLFSENPNECEGSNLDEVDKNIQIYDYLIFIKLDQENNSILKRIRFISERDTRLISSLSSNRRLKVIFVFPFTQRNITYKEIENLKNDLLKKIKVEFTILYLGDLISQKTKVKEEDYLGKLMADAVYKKKVKISNKDFLFYPLSVSSAVRQIIKNLFSFSFYGKEAAIVSSGLAQSQLIKIIEKQEGPIGIKRIYSKTNYLPANTKGKIIIRQKLEKLIIDKLSSLASLPQSSINRTIKSQATLNIPGKKDELVKKVEKSSKRDHIIEWVKKGTLVLATILILPTLFLSISVFSQHIAWNFFEKGNRYIVQRLFRVSSNLSVFIKGYLEITQNIPLNNIFVFSSKKTAEILIESAEVGLSTLRVVGEYNNLFDKIIGENDYKIDTLTSKISIELDYLYKKSGFIESEASQLSGFGKVVITNMVLGERHVFIKERIPQLNRILQELPELLGEEKEKSYLIVFQNNLNLRPTGGVIESLAFVTISNGKVTNIEVSDTKDIDKNLKGFVSAPDLLSENYKTNSWNLRDSNWDPNYPTSAEQMEWFIDKEIDRKIDGVFAIDLDFASKLLIISDTIHFENLNIEINSNNFQNNIIFINDNNLWDELLGKLLENIISSNYSSRIKLLRTIFNGFEEKHLQVFLHNVNAERAIAELNWGGSLPEDSCYENCLVDWAGLVEASIDENGSSAFIRRTADFNIVFEEGLIKRRYVVLLENLADMDKNYIYNAYIRIVTPFKSGFSPVAIMELDESKEIIPDIVNVRGHKEAGVHIEIKPKTSVILQFIWESPNKLDFQSLGEYNLLLRKQPGITEFPTKINIDIKDEDGFLNKLNVLTNDNQIEYNTKLSRDFVSRIYW